MLSSPCFPKFRLLEWKSRKRVVTHILRQVLRQKSDGFKSVTYFFFIYGSLFSLHPSDSAPGNREIYPKPICTHPIVHRKEIFFLVNFFYPISLSLKRREKTHGAGQEIIQGLIIISNERCSL